MVLWTIVMQYTDRVVTAATILTADSSYFKASVYIGASHVNRCELFSISHSAIPEHDFRLGLYVVYMIRVTKRVKRHWL